MSKLLSNGCSFLTPRPKDGVNTFTTDIISKHYDLELCNLAMGGRGNDRIAFTTKHWILDNKIFDIFVVIGFSSPNRMDYITNDGWKKGRIPGTDLTWRTWKVSENFRFVNSQPGWDVGANETMRLMNTVLDLQHFFKYHSVPYLFYNSLPISLNLSYKDFKDCFDNIDQSRYFKIETSQYQQIMRTNDVVSPQDPHPNTQGHKNWAQQLIEFIDANDLRTIR
jgi:hypothetical protein